MATFKNVSVMPQKAEGEPVVDEEVVSVPVPDGPNKKTMKAIFHNSTLICSKCLWHLKEYTKKVTVPDEKNPSRPGSETRLYYGCPNENCENHGTSFSVPSKNVTLTEK